MFTIVIFNVKMEIYGCQYSLRSQVVFIGKYFANGLVRSQDCSSVLRFGEDTNPWGRGSGRVRESTCARGSEGAS